MDIGAAARLAAQNANKGNDKWDALAQMKNMKNANNNTASFGNGNNNGMAAGFGS